MKMAKLDVVYKALSTKACQKKFMRRKKWVNNQQNTQRTLKPKLQRIMGQIAQNGPKEFVNIEKWIENTTNVK